MVKSKKKGDEEVKKIIPMTYDKVFKGVLESAEVREYLISIISEITKIPKEALKEDMRFKNSEMKAGARKKKNI